MIVARVIAGPYTKHDKPLGWADGVWEGSEAAGACRRQAFSWDRGGSGESRQGRKEYGKGYGWSSTPTLVAWCGTHREHFY